MTALIYRFADPMFVGLALMAVALLRLRRSCPERKWTWRLAALALLLLWLDGMPAAAWLNYRLLERPFPPVERRPEGVGAIVVLGGGSYPAIAGSPSSRLAEATTRRCLRAAELYRDGPRCPIIVCGGIVRRSEIDVPESSTMRDLLIDLGVPPDDILVDAVSRNTWENAAEGMRLMAERGIASAALVTDASHLARATRCFRRQGAAVTPVGCGYITWHGSPPQLSFLPAAYAANLNYYAVHEWVGLAWYALRGRI